MLKILVADNNKTITRILKTALEEEGYNVVSSNSIEETRKIILNNRIDIAFIDTKFETEKDGYELIKRIKNAVPHTKFVVLVNALEKPEVDLMNELGILGYLTKPIDSRKLFQIISEIQESAGKLEQEEGEKRSKEEIRSEVYEEDIVEKLEDTEYPSTTVPKVKMKKAKESEEETKEAQKIEQTESDIYQERKDISSSWTGEFLGRSLEELFTFIQTIKDMFGSAKQMRQEAELYIKDIASLVNELKRKIIEIPDSEKIISRIIKEEILEIIQTKIAEEIYKDLEDKILTKLKEEMRKHIAELKEELYTAQMNQNDKTSLDTAISKLKDEISNYVDEVIEKTKGQIISEIPTSQILESIRSDVRKIYEEINSIKAKSSQVEVLEKIEEDFLSIDDIGAEHEVLGGKSRGEEEKETDFISFMEI